MEMNYSWKMAGLAKKVDPDLAAKELQRLTDIYGSITPEILLSEASKKESILYPIFEWDDSKAAFNYRLQQARILINNIQVTVITDGESRDVAVYEVVSRSGGYKSIETFTKDDTDFIKDDIIRQLNLLKGKLKLYKEFNKVLVYIEKALEVI